MNTNQEFSENVSEDLQIKLQAVGGFLRQTNISDESFDKVLGIFAELSMSSYYGAMTARAVHNEGFNLKMDAETGIVKMFKVEEVVS